MYVLWLSHCYKDNEKSTSTNQMIWTRSISQNKHINYYHIKPEERWAFVEHVDRNLVEKQTIDGMLVIVDFNQKLVAFSRSSCKAKLVGLKWTSMEHGKKSLFDQIPSPLILEIFLSTRPTALLKVPFFIMLFHYFLWSYLAPSSNASELQATSVADFFHT